MRSYNSASTLPIDYSPGENSIIIGRGRQVKNHIANKKFDKMVAEIAKEYQAASCKAEKGNILSKLITQINAQGPDAGFVKKDPITGRWLQVEESLARTTAAQAIRNHLHASYRSSKQFKQKRRLQQIRDGLIPTSGSTGSLKRRAAAAASCVSPESSDDEGESVSAAVPTERETFSILFNAFGAAEPRSDDPFAPTPLASDHNNSNELKASQGQLSGSITIKKEPTIASAVATPVSPLAAGPSILEAFDSHLMSLLSQMAPTPTTAAV